MQPTYKRNFDHIKSVVTLDTIINDGLVGSWIWRLTEELHVINGFDGVVSAEDNDLRNELVALCSELRAAICQHFSDALTAAEALRKLPSSMNVIDKDLLDFYHPEEIAEGIMRSAGFKKNRFIPLVDALEVELRIPMVQSL
jgi:hypothetical protein